MWSNTAKVIAGAVVIIGLGVATVFTGGAAGVILAGAFHGAFLGAMTGAAVGGVIGGLSDGQGWSWSGFMDGVADGFMTGAIVGGISGGIGGIGAKTGVAAKMLYGPTSVFQSTFFQVGANAILAGGVYNLIAGKDATVGGMILSMTTAGLGERVLPKSGAIAIIMALVYDFFTNMLERTFKKI